MIIIAQPRAAGSGKQEKDPREQNAIDESEIGQMGMIEAVDDTFLLLDLQIFIPLVIQILVAAKQTVENSKIAPEKYIAG